MKYTIVSTGSGTRSFALHASTIEGVNELLEAFVPIWPLDAEYKGGFMSLMISAEETVFIHENNKQEIIDTMRQRREALNSFPATAAWLMSEGASNPEYRQAISAYREALAKCEN